MTTILHVGILDLKCGPFKPCREMTPKMWAGYTKLWALKAGIITLTLIRFLDCRSARTLTQPQKKIHKKFQIHRTDLKLTDVIEGCLVEVYREFWLTTQFTLIFYSFLLTYKLDETSIRSS